MTSGARPDSNGTGRALEKGNKAGDAAARKSPMRLTSALPAAAQSSCTRVFKHGNRRRPTRAYRMRDVPLCGFAQRTVADHAIMMQPAMRTLHAKRQRLHAPRVFGINLNPASDGFVRIRTTERQLAHRYPPSSTRPAQKSLLASMQFDYFSARHTPRSLPARRNS
jgi:hypothetical protein